MMTKLLSRIKANVDAELKEARKNNGLYFNSSHEGFGVIAEELEEAREEASDTINSFEPMVRAIRKNDKGVLDNLLVSLENHATLAACEFIQVAAMARKMRESEEVKTNDR